MDEPFKFRKLTGPIEHWLTTFHQGYWGFRPDKKEAWEEIDESEVFVFHASSSEFLESPRGALTDVDTGIIGLGRVGAKSTKNEPAWWQEIHQDGDYPYLIHFAEIYWFGDTDAIRDAPVADKDVDEMVADVHALAENIITFGEMKERTGYRIPAQGSPTNIRSPEKLFPLLRERIEGNFEPEREEDEGESGTTTSVRSRDRDRSLDEDGTGSREVTYEHSVRDTISGTIEHEETLDIFEEYLESNGFTGGETQHSDLIMQSDDHVLLGEAKSIHEDNESEQIRKGLGQLLEYRQRDIYTNKNLVGLELTVCLILSRAPTEQYQEILRSVEDDGIYTFWIEEGDIEGLDASMLRLDSLVK